MSDTLTKEQAKTLMQDALLPWQFTDYGGDEHHIVVYANRAEKLGLGEHDFAQSNTLIDVVRQPTTEDVRGFVTGEATGEILAYTLRLEELEAIAEETLDSIVPAPDYAKDWRSSIAGAVREEHVLDYATFTKILNAQISYAKAQAEENQKNFSMNLAVPIEQTFKKRGFIAYRDYLELYYDENTQTNYAEGAIRKFLGNALGNQYPYDITLPDTVKDLTSPHGRSGSAVAGSQQMRLFEKTLDIHDEPEYSAYHKYLDAKKNFKEFWGMYQDECKSPNRDYSRDPYATAMENFCDYLNRWHYHKDAKRETGMSAP